MRTSGTFEQDTPQSDGQIFLGATDFQSPTLAATALSLLAAGKLAFVTPVSATSDLFADLKEILRTGVLASAANGYRAFGTTGPPPVPGPSSVPNTSDPLAIVGHPPIKTASLPTIKGPITGPVPKGIQINYVDLIYTVLGANATSVSVGLTKTKFGAAGAGATAPTVTNLITFGANSLPVAVAANPVTTRVAVTTAQAIMLTDFENEVLLHFETVNPAGCTVDFYGAVLGVSFNYN